MLVKTQDWKSRMDSPETQPTLGTRYKMKTNKGNAKCGISPRLKIWHGDLDLWPWKSIGFQILLRTVCTKFGQNPLKDAHSSIHKDVTEGRTDNSITISLHNFVGEGIITYTIHLQKDDHDFCPMIPSQSFVSWFHIPMIFFLKKKKNINVKGGRSHFNYFH